MAAVTTEDRFAAAPAPASATRAGRPGGNRAWTMIRVNAWRWAVFLVAGVFFLLPLAASFEFSLHDPHGGYSFASYRQFAKMPGFGSALWLSAKLALMAVGIMLVLLVPTMTLVHLRFPWLRRVIETITVLPLVIPPIVLVVGFLGAFSSKGPSWLLSSSYGLGFEYVILALPFAYRSLDAGMSAIDLKTLVEASRSLGGGWATELFRVVLPNLRTAVLGAAVMTVALVLGEFAMASVLLWVTFPVWVVSVAQTQAGVSVAVSMMSLLLTWILLMLLITLGSRRGRQANILGGF
jgi:putative spermidine/putrescine transport system permease protein